MHQKTDEFTIENRPGQVLSGLSVVSVFLADKTDMTTFAQRSALER